MSDLLKMLALDDDDLKVMSSYAQDAVLKADAIEYFPPEKLLALPVNRFAWEAKSARRWFFKKFERRNAVLHFNRVTNVKSIGIDRDDASQVLSLLAITFAPDAKLGAPSGTIDLTFAGDAALVLDVECVEAKLTDLGGAWSASRKPRHIT